MYEMIQIKAVLNWYIYSRHLTVDALTVVLDVNSTKSIMTIENPDIKEIKKWLKGLIDPNDTAADKLGCIVNLKPYRPFTDPQWWKFDLSDPQMVLEHDVFLQ